MRQLPSFSANLISVIAGVLFLMMNAAFVLIPYSLAGHPGDVKIVRATTATYHPT
jgi:hypothetical protein